MPVSQGDLPVSQVLATQTTGYGSTANKVRRFAGATTTGLHITYADSATDGATFTINVAGLYTISYVDTENNWFGVSLNASGLGGQSTISGLVTGEIVAIEQTRNTANELAGLSTTVQLAAGSVLRAHSHAGVGNSSAKAFFLIRRIA